MVYDNSMNADLCNICLQMTNDAQTGLLIKCFKFNRFKVFPRSRLLLETCEVESELLI